MGADAPTPREVLDSLWAEMLLDACASDGPIRDAEVRTAIARYRPKIEAALTRREPLDVDRLAEAMWNAARNPDNATWQEMTARPGNTSGDLYRNRAAHLAAEYARLEAER